MATAPENMRIWDAVAKTNPDHTKRVNQRGGFTAISAHYQIMRATETFGPIGLGWGYTTGEPSFHESLVFVPVTIWHGERGNVFGPLYGGAEWKNGNRLDSDAVKKATTDGLTKALSQLGFNADVFLGRFDDNKYVAEMQAEFAPANDEAPPEKRIKLDGPYTSPTALKTAAREFVHTLRGCGDIDMFEAFLATDDAKAFVAQLERDMPEWAHGGDGMPEGFTPMLALIAKLRSDLEAEANDHARGNPLTAG